LSDADPTNVDPPRSRVAEFFASFSDMLRLPCAFWIVMAAFVGQSTAYFGMLILMTIYLSGNMAWGDSAASITVSIFAGFVTLFMLGAAGYAESFGLRRAIIFALALATIGRAVLSYGVHVPGAMNAIVVIMVSLMIVALAEGILQPVCYSGIKQYTTEKTSSMGYALIYAFMNLGVFVIGGISSWVRPGVDRLLYDTGAEPGFWDGPLQFFVGRVDSGVEAVFWVCTGINALALVLFLFFMTKEAESAKLRPDRAEEMRKENQDSLGVRLKAYFLEGPFTNARFVFFIFMLLPVRTLFVHQWLTLPEYIIRAYSKGIGDSMELIVSWINPLVIFTMMPLATALTKRVHIYKVMFVGSLISAVPTFILCFGPSLPLLITYCVIFSLGEALWTGRFLEYASELAPEGRLAQYMGLAGIPWLLAKMTTGLYSGYLLNKYCAEGVPQETLQTGTLWFIYGCIAMTTPIGLWLARKWVMRGFDDVGAAIAHDSD
jgi:proton-dependent oligopeptide transporter, POT family